MAEVYNFRKAPAAYAAAFLDKEHATIQRAIASAILGARSAVNVLAFGDGSVGTSLTHDDTKAIQSAATAAAGGILYFPKPRARYNISAPITLPNSVRVLGDGWPELHNLTVGNAMLYPGNDCEIAYLSFTGTGATSAPYFGRACISVDPGATGTIGARLYFHHNIFDATVATTCIGGNNVIDARITDNHFVLSSNAEHGIYISTGGSNVWIERNHLEKTSSNGFACTAINVKGSSHLWIRGNHGFGVGWDGYVVGLSSANNSHVQITDNHMDTLLSTAQAIGVGNASTDTDILIAENDIDGGYFGIQSQAARVSILGNRIRNCTFRGVEIDGTTNSVANTTVQDNDVQDCVGGIMVTAAGANTYLLNNTLVGSSGTGLHYVSGSTVGLSNGNVVHGYPTPYTYGVGVTVGVNYTV